MPEETSIGGNEIRFHSTLWTQVIEAKEGSRDALDRLIGLYWKPVYFFIRRRGHDVESAKDLAQGFFGALLEREFLDRVSPDRGRFRSFILASLVNYLSDQYDRTRAKKRGGDLDFQSVEADLPASGPTPEEAFQRAWARETVERAMDRLRLVTPPEDMILFTGATPPGMSVQERKQRFRKLKARLREFLRMEVAPTVESDQQAESEIRDLLAAIA